MITGRELYRLQLDLHRQLPEKHPHPNACCDDWDEANGICVHEICPGCYCGKRHGQNVCDACHEYNLGHKPYLKRYGSDNVRVRGLRPLT